jgi:hypothetical protein
LALRFLRQLPGAGRAGPSATPRRRPLG